ncbi:MAG: DUF1638 domain-containing protein [Novosphingobium sp.]|uniref:DUF1638 domain-containing protein n=1 Tax=Novosphingobium sp. TaxID=1874826 RepID=UPI003C7EBCEE
MDEPAARRAGGRQARLGRRARPQEAVAAAPESLVTTSANPEGPTLVLACGALANEIIALREQLGVADDAMVLHCLPAELHNRPGQIAPRVDAFLTEHRHKYSRVLLGYGDCGTGGALDKVLQRHDANRLPHAHCYEFFATTPRFNEITEAEIGSYFVTDFLVRHFDRLVWEGLGLDTRPEMLATYFGNYRDLVYLAQTDTPALQAKAQEAAERLGLNYVYHQVGYGDLTQAIQDAAHV